MRLRFTLGARVELQHLVAHSVERNGHAQTRRYRAQINERLDLLRRNPRLGRARPEIGPETRSLVAGLHILFYEIDGDEIVVTSIRHQHEDWMGATTGSDADHPDDHPD